MLGEVGREEGQDVAGSDGEEQCSDIHVNTSPTFIPAVSLS